MKHACLFSMTLSGGSFAEPVRVESFVRRGLPSLHIGGISGAGRETADRIRSAILACSVQLPLSSITVNVAPVDLPKKGGAFDLPIAAAILLALGVRSFLNRLSLQETILLGELGLSGEVLGSRLSLPLILQAKARGYKNVILSSDDLASVKSIEGMTFFPVQHLSDLLEGAPEPVKGVRLPIPPHGLSDEDTENLESILLSPAVWKSIQVCAAGWHSLLLIGAPGMGKSSIARLIASLLPSPTPEEMLEILALEPLLGIASDGSMKTPRRPVRQPHHSITARALVGGGLPPVPGEITRAHQGMLILDEFAEYARPALQALREPMEERRVVISRGGLSGEFPARFLMVATSNPCPCGHFRDTRKQCICTPARLRSYRQRIMGPLRDRIAMEVIVDTGVDAVHVPNGAESFLERIEQAREIQRERFESGAPCWNGEIEQASLEEKTEMDEAALRIWKDVLGSGKFSMRKLAGFRRLARTLGDLAGASCIRAEDLVDAFRFHILDDYWIE